MGFIFFATCLSNNEMETETPLRQLYALQAILDQVSSNTFRSRESDALPPDVQIAEKSVALDGVKVLRYGASHNDWTLEKTIVVPGTSEWEHRVERVYAGADAVQNAFRTGIERDALDDIFKQYLDPKQDVLHGSCVKLSGDGSFDTPWDVVEPDMFYTIGPFVGAKDGAVVPFFSTVPLYQSYRGEEGNRRSPAGVSRLPEARTLFEFLSAGA